MGQITSRDNAPSALPVTAHAHLPGTLRHPEFQGVGVYFAPFSRDIEVLCKWLSENAGINLMVLSYPRQAKRWIQRHSSLLDFLMVDMDMFDDTGDGIRFANNLRATDPTLPIIFTASTSVQGGFCPERFPVCDASLSKPLSFSQTMNAIEMAVLAP